MTFGIVPTGPETGYGYIHRGQEETLDEQIAYQVSRFVEKPNKETAESYIASGEYYWNSGMFMFRAKNISKSWKNSDPIFSTPVKRLFRVAKKATNLSKSIAICLLRVRMSRSITR